jgi:hypothetical protein
MVAVAVAGCAGTQPPAPVTPAPVPAPLPAPVPPPVPAPVPIEVLPPVDEAKQVAELIAFYTRVAALPTEEQKREFGAATQAYNRDRSMVNRIRLAVALALPGTPFEDDARAIGLLEPYAAPTAGSSPLRQFAALLHAQLSDRVRWQKRADQLKDQLDALRAVERSLIERERGQPPRSAPRPQ